MPQAYVNYYKKSLEMLKQIPEGQKPSLLLHACCGPCSTFPLTFLCPHFTVTILFNNSNIYPSQEYERRLGELKKFLAYFARDYGYEVGLVVMPYDNDAYNRDLESYAAEEEGGQRCRLCYRKRMKEAYDYAEDHDYAYFTTVMTISRQKDSEIINGIGALLEKDHSRTKYFFSDFKKNKGIDIAREMRLRYGLYNQLYCGCKYTYAKGLAKAKEKDLNWEG
jgi:epoxyqueuosine reductase